MIPALGGVMLAGAVGLLAFVAKVLRDGYLDVRPRHAPRTEPAFLYAAEEPFWFYGLVAALTALAILLLTLAWRMLRHGRRPP